MAAHRLATWLFLALSLFCSDCRDRDATARKPNILLILADDLGYGEPGAYGQEKIETPHIDALAAGGMRFTQHYSGSPVCAPSRCVLMTGLHTGHSHIRGNDEWRERGDVWDYAKAVENPDLEGQRPIPAGTVTVSRLLQEAGYRTAIVGKWGLGGPLTEGIPNLQGFDFFFGYNCQRQAHTYFPKHLWRNREKIRLSNELVVPGTGLAAGADPLDPRSYSPFYLEEYSPDLLLREAVDFLRENKDTPFFLYFATPLPHVPLQAPGKRVRHYAEKFGDEEPYLGERGYFPHRTPRAAYAAMISCLDQQVGQLLSELKDLGIYENTLVLFTSDNGPSYAGGADPAFFDSGGPFRSEYGFAKGFVHEGGIRVPLIASWPGRIAPGVESNHISAFYDLLPTLCEVAGTAIPRETDGLSFLPTLVGERDRQRRHDFLYWEFPAYGGQQAVRLGRWKGIRRDLFAGKLEVELYDLDQDIQERNDLAALHPDIVAGIEKILEREHVPSAIAGFRFEVLGDHR